MKLLVALVWILFGYSLAFGEDLPVKKAANRWPICIAQFCFGDQAPRESDLTEMYGSGIFKKEDEDSFHCYRDFSQNLFLKFDVHNDIPPFLVSILVSDEPVCAKAGQPTKSFKELKTPEGLKVGDTYEKTLHLYGVPQYVRTGEELKTLTRFIFASGQAMGFDKAVEYGPNEADNLLETWLFFRNEKITAMLISISE
jgi:hypothetical protein